jgi:ABC-type dipeptide/oligopeptide/nickel transport system ATPase component
VTHQVDPPLLEVKNLKTYFFTEDGVVKAVDGVDFYVNPGEVLGLVGESGCGKSVTSLSIMRLIGIPGKVVEGDIFFEGKELLKLPESEMVAMRGNRMSMIFQQPQSSLNPVFKVGDQVAEVLQIHQKMGKDESWERAVELLHVVGIADPENKAHAYPHEMSGGQAQRVMIAMALALNPQLLIADEPTTALDVTIQAQILDLMRDLRARMNTAVILITHDLGIIAEMADRIAVMYAGRIVEESLVDEIYDNPSHPYTQGLIASIPVLGCLFAPRCRKRLEYQLEICTQEEPGLINISPKHAVRCWLYQDDDHKGHKAPLNASV